MAIDELAVKRVLDDFEFVERLYGVNFRFPKSFYRLNKDEQTAVVIKYKEQARIKKPPDQKGE